MSDGKKIDMAFVHSAKEYLMQKSGKTDSKMPPVYSLTDFYEVIQGCTQREREFYRELFLGNLEGRLERTPYDEDSRRDIALAAGIAVSEILRHNRNPETISLEDFHNMMVSGRKRYLEGEIVEEFGKFEEKGVLKEALAEIFGKKQ